MAGRAEATRPAAPAARARKRTRASIGAGGGRERIWRGGDGTGGGNYETQIEAA